MPKPKTPNAPSYRLHKPTGQAVVTLSGKDHYLGEHGTDKSRTMYDRLVAEWLERGRRLPEETDALTVDELVDEYRERHVETYYVKNGRPTSEQTSIRYAMKPLRRLYGPELVRSFDPAAFKAVRQVMIGQRWCRSNINGQMSRIRQMFRWGVENGLVPSHILEGLRAVRGLAKGRTEFHGARESDPVRPVAETHIQAIKEHVSAQVWAMIQVQLLTACRPGEVVTMRAREIDTSGKLWIYRPAEHKNQHHDRDRVIVLGPHAQAYIKPFLKRDLDAYLFSPAEADATRRDELHAQRATPMNQGNRPGSNRREWPKRKPKSHYTTASYRRAIESGCDRAFPLPADLANKLREPKETLQDWHTRVAQDTRQAIADWRHAHRWHPNQLRHTGATRIRKDFGIEVARAVLGHAKTTMTGLYAELDQAKAADVMLKIG